MSRRCVLGSFGIPALLLLFFSCSGVKRTMETPVYVHDTAYITKTLHDSTYIDRWHTIYQQSDTVYIRDSIAVIKYSLITDTAYRYVEKPVTITRTERVEVKKPLSWWVKVQLYALWAILAAFAIYSLYIIYKLKR